MIDFNKRPRIEWRRKYKTNYFDRKPFAAWARLLQSHYREQQCWKSSRRYGNFLDEPLAYKKGLNFLTPAIKKMVDQEFKANAKRKGKEVKVLKRDRLYENMLASQPLAFNLFGELIHDLPLATAVFQKLFGKQIKKVTSIEFEISPGRRDKKYTGDSSAFDVFVEFEGRKGNGFIGIEVKYAEHLQDKPATFKDRYREVARSSGKFNANGLRQLLKMPKSVEQVWRDHLLALSMLRPINEDYNEGFFVYLYPEGNVACSDALMKYQKYLKSDDPKESLIWPVTLEQFHKALMKCCQDEWVDVFYARYLDFGKLNSIKD